MTLRVTFLGTSGAVPTTERNPSAVFLNREGEGVLFDCGEGTQRQMMRYGTGFGVSAICLTHVHGDHVYGLPGLLQTWDFQDRQDPLAIYTPIGTRSEVTALITACGGDVEYPVHVMEVEPGETVISTDDYHIVTFRTAHRTRSVGYALIEADRKGRFRRQRAESLGIPPGPLYGRLHEGKSVELEDGRVIEPAQVVGAPRPGRRVIYTGDTAPTDEVVTAAARADLLIHDGTFADTDAERAQETGHATAREAGEVAAQAEARRLALTHISPRYARDASRLVAEAREVFDGEIFLARDGLEFEVPFPD